ncbi:MAG: tetratricopeptide repeat protein [Calditrichia bacterium]
MTSRWLLLVALFGLLFTACEDKLSEKDYFDQAQQYMGQENWQKAEENFARITTDFPEGVYAAKSLFMVGYINANHLKDFDRAKEYYSKFIEKFPEHDLADDAQYELTNLGKPVEELPFLGGEQPAGDKPSAN